MLNKKSIVDIDVNGKKVFVRVDYNVPMDAEQNITNDTRIRATLPTVNYLLEQNAAPIVIKEIIAYLILWRLSMAPLE